MLNIFFFFNEKPEIWNSALKLVIKNECGEFHNFYDFQDIVANVKIILMLIILFLWARMANHCTT